MAVIVNGDVYLNVWGNSVMGSKWKYEAYTKLVKEGYAAVKATMVIPPANKF
jgi:hypothetical protein